MCEAERNELIRVAPSPDLQIKKKHRVYVFSRLFVPYTSAVRRRRRRRHGVDYKEFAEIDCHVFFLFRRPTQSRTLHRAPPARFLLVLFNWANCCEYLGQK